MRSTIGELGLGEFQLQQFGTPQDVLIRISQQPGGEEAQQAAVQKVRDALGDQVEYRRVEVVGPRVSGELLSYGIMGLMLAIGSIFVYLWFRFEWQFALGAMIANVHDLVLTIGFMSLAQIDFDLTSIAALLTILGYSLNDTVVIYDRIREMLRRYKRMPMPELLNALDQSTLSRSVITHVTVTSGLAGPAAVRRPGHSQLHRDHDVRRRAGRHLYLDLHRRADPDLSRRRDRPGRHPGRRPRPEARGPSMTADASGYCEQLVREADKDRFLATLFAPAARRPALFALYAFNAEIARVRDIAREPMPGEIRLQWWREVVEGGRSEEARGASGRRGAAGDDGALQTAGAAFGRPDRRPRFRSL